MPIGQHLHIPHRARYGRREMEWALDGRSATAIAAVRREITAYLGRHAEPDSDVAGAEVVIAELLSNALEHAPGPAWVRTSWEGERPRLEVHDLGPGFVLDPRLPAPDSERGRGLFIVNAIADDLARASKTAGGSAVSATLPVRRRVERSHDPPRDTFAALPPKEEARPDGTFGKEAFLRALVVEMAQTVEADQGPDVAAATVAQVGADVGGRMEEAYRTARGIAGRLSPQQLADLYVRLKGAYGPRVEHRSDPDLVEGCRAAMHGDPFLYPAAIAAYMRDFLHHGECLAGPPKDPLAGAS